MESNDFTGIMATEKNLNWPDAILKVFEEERRPLHYTEIAELIASRDYKKTIGATPANTVNVCLNDDIRKNKEKSKYVRVGRGLFSFRDGFDGSFGQNTEKLTLEDSGERKLIKSIGIFWERSKVDWKSKPDMFGTQLQNSDRINFKDQIGIYLLHDGRETIYVGKAIKTPITSRLLEHNKDRMAGRWTRFSWFGFYGATDKGELIKEQSVFDNVSLLELGNLLESILIESLEPRLNRKRGENWDSSEIEYIQFEDPAIAKNKTSQQILELLRDS